MKVQRSLVFSCCHLSQVFLCRRGSVEPPAPRLIFTVETDTCWAPLSRLKPLSCEPPLTQPSTLSNLSCNCVVALGLSDFCLSKSLLMLEETVLADILCKCVKCNRSQHFCCYCVFSGYYVVIWLPAVKRCLRVVNSLLYSRWLVSHVARTAWKETINCYFGLNLVIMLIFVSIYNTSKLSSHPSSIQVSNQCCPDSKNGSRQHRVIVLKHKW